MKTLKTFLVSTLMLVSATAMAGNCPSPSNVKFNSFDGRTGYWSGMGQDGKYYGPIDMFTLDILPAAFVDTAPVIRSISFEEASRLEGDELDAEARSFLDAIQAHGVTLCTYSASDATGNTQVVIGLQNGVTGAEDLADIFFDFDLDDAW